MGGVQQCQELGIQCEKSLLQISSLHPNSTSTGWTLGHDLRMRRRKIAVVAGFCLSFFLGTVLNLLCVPGFDHIQQIQDRGSTVPLGASWQGQGGSLDLLKQLQERYQEVVRYREHQAPVSASERLLRPLERRLMDLAQQSSEHNQKWESPKRSISDQNILSPSHPGTKIDLSLQPPLLGCQDISKGTDVHYLGSGYTKAVYKLVLNDTLSVALKSVDFGGHDIQNCVKRYRTLEDCYRLASFKIVKEMILLQRLQHPNILQVSMTVHQHSEFFLFWQS